ncbi:2813_t:CDS:2 [Cetraspora pellucida]|uniref:2813_t:CDS:1 n=1 Tax=Cetraspora pellucida TaxID=1433469 RepID=A0ACA9MTP2_9GLOM|nr:2813_t:CDS:2 [Cetraspora pellucida]
MTKEKDRKIADLQQQLSKKNDLLNKLNGGKAQLERELAEEKKKTEKLNQEKEILSRKLKEVESYLEKYKEMVEEAANFSSDPDSVKLRPIQEKKLKPDLGRLIGKGGFGEVYHGKWDLQEVAVKKLYLSSQNVSESEIKDIKKEINILQRLKNRYIIQYYDTYSDSHDFLIIMDYAENGTLTKFINENKDKYHNRSLDDVIISQMILGLAYIHQQGVIHRDLKSMNILLTKNNDVKISDFGLSRTKDISSSYSKHAVGTIGMVIWEITTRRTKPFENKSVNDIVICVVRGVKEKISDDTPENISYIIAQELISVDNKLLDYQKPSQSQSIKEISTQPYSLDNLSFVSKDGDFKESFKEQAQIQIPPK